MEPYFIWNGRDSREMGVVITELPPIILPAERAEQVTIPGRSGTLTRTEGEAVYDGYIKTIQLANRRAVDMREIAVWLRGEGTLILSSEPGFSYRARVIQEAQMSRMFRNTYQGAVSFAVQPLRAQVPVEADIAGDTTGTTLTVYNPGDVTARPVIRVTGSGTVTLSTDRGSMEIEIPDGATGFVLDTDAGVITDSALTMNLGEYVSFEDDGLAAFWLPKGSTTLTWDGTVTALTVTPRWRWL